MDPSQQDSLSNSPSRPPSKLEKLPDELLERIFVLSGNLNLAKTSRRFHCIVDPKGFQKELTKQVCAHVSNNSTSPVCVAGDEK